MSTELVGADEWHQWEEVKKHVASGHKLYRASAPNYKDEGPGKDHDKTQKLTKTAVEFLVEGGKKIDSIISLNKYSYNDDEKKLLSDKKIAYLHISVEDYHAPKLSEVHDAIQFFKDHKSTLVHCGFGWGRTGTGVTALQLDYTKGKQPLDTVWHDENHVEKPVQFDVLHALIKEYK